MTNPIKWLFRDPELEEAEKRLDDYIDRIVRKIREAQDSILVEVDVDFPKAFTHQSKNIAKGKVEWRNFHSNEDLKEYSLHCKMKKGAILREHRHPHFDECIYVVSGSIISLVESKSQGSIIVPPEFVGNQGDEEGWYRIPAGTSHVIQAIEENTHFVSKFAKPNAS